MKLIMMGDNNEGAIVDVESVGRGFASLIEQFDRDPDNGADLADGAPLEVTAEIVGAGYGSQLCTPMAAETARVSAATHRCGLTTFLNISTATSPAWACRGR